MVLIEVLVLRLLVLRLLTSSVEIRGEEGFVQLYL
jgi:hypothetical protein